jgi:hypothetical protein
MLSFTDQRNVDSLSERPTLLTSFLDRVITLCTNLPVATVIAFGHFVIEEFQFIMEAHFVAVGFG